MGGTTWSGATYAANTGAKIKAGATFSYDRTAKASGTYKAHKDLDPKHVAGPKSPLAGQPVREARDNADNPESNPVLIGFDVTGSMGGIPRELQKRLAGVYQLLLTKAYISNPMVAFSAYGDHKTDHVPLQVSQFEADNAAEEALDKLFLEGNGGGNNGESPFLLWYYAARQVHTDAFEKRGKKGYFFFIADEISHKFDADAVKKQIGLDEAPAGLTNEALVAELKKKWEPFVLLINNSAAGYQGSEKFYTNLFGKKNVIIVENQNVDNIAEIIAMAIGNMEDAIDDATQDLLDAGVSAADAKAVVLATANVGAGNRGAVVRGTTDFGLGNQGAARL